MADRVTKKEVASKIVCWIKNTNVNIDKILDHYSFPKSKEKRDGFRALAKSIRGF